MCVYVCARACMYAAAASMCASVDVNMHACMQHVIASRQSALGGLPFSIFFLQTHTYMHIVAALEKLFPIAVQRNSLDDFYVLWRLPPPPPPPPLSATAGGGGEGGETDDDDEYASTKLAAR